MSLEFGVPVHGNYHGYYTKRPAARDPRLALLEEDMFIGCSVLDVGCNEGAVTCEIGQSWHAEKVVGVDIDDSLIRAAWKHRRSVWSTQAPRSELSGFSDPPYSNRRRTESKDQAEQTSYHEISGYFPLSAEHMFGPLPIPIANDGASKSLFPSNTTFYTADWVNDGIPGDSSGYDIVVACVHTGSRLLEQSYIRLNRFSVTKWIHLNGGDAAIHKFFNRAYSVLRPGGKFILEPQTWESYAKARRMSQRLKENAKSLKLRPEDFDDILESIGFNPARHYGSTGEGGTVPLFDSRILSSLKSW